MTAATVTAYDATHANFGQLPAGQACGYTTGTPDIKWTPQDWSAKPTAVRIDQDAMASDFTADVLDVENGAATIAEAPVWAVRSLLNFNNGTRPGQRKPAVYCSRSNVTPVVNSLIAGHVTSGIGLWVADWTGNAVAAGDEVKNASGPFPVIAVQYRNAGLYDVSIFSLAWLATTSMAPTPVAVSGTQEGWRWCSKCSGLVYQGMTNSASTSSCPAGGKHAPGTWNYSLPYVHS